MQWKCPHCDAPLAIADDQLNQGWSFSQCSACNGFALVQAKNEKQARPKIRTSQRHLKKRLAEHSVEQASKIDQAISRIEQTRSLRIQQQTRKMTLAPEATPTESFIPDLVPIEEESIGNSPIVQAAREIKSLGSILPPPLPEISANQREGSPLLPVFWGIMGALIVGSGLYIYKKGESLWEKAKAKTQITKTSSIHDRIQIDAAAPGGQMQSLEPGIRKEQARDQSHMQEERIAPIVREIKLSSRNPVNTVVQVIEDSVKLRSGPGTSFPIVAQAKSGINYLITDWKDDWLKIVAEKDAKKPAKPTAWIKNDMIKPVAEGNLARDSDPE